jgi:hypothetical protein
MLPCCIDPDGNFAVPVDASGQACSEITRLTEMFPRTACE